MIRSHSLVFSDFNTKWYKKWAKQLKQDVQDTGKFQRYSNKFWQNAIIAAVLEERKILKPGIKAIGFGVGKERLPSLFAKHGLIVTATDQDFRSKSAKHWAKNELSSKLSDLNELKICEPKKFEKNALFTHVDMKNIPIQYFNKFDFLWSNCSLGHLGSIDQGIDFIINSTKCLKPGGYAIHTTEINIISDNYTVDKGDTVIFRPKDFYNLSQRLSNIGCRMDPPKLKLSPAFNKCDSKISMAPEFGTDYSKIQVGGHLTTQIVLIIKNTGKINDVSKKINLKRATLNYNKNLKQQKLLIKNNSFIKLIKEFENYDLPPDAILPIKKNMLVTLKNNPKSFFLEYKNMTKFPLFSAHNKFTTTSPILLATCNPIDRNSSFAAANWHNDLANRASANIFAKKEGKWHPTPFVQPFDTFAFKITLDPQKNKKGTYDECFSLVQEGVKHLNNAQIRLRIKLH